MKLQTYEALEKHLLEAHSDHLSNFYLIACPRESERKFLIEEVAQIIRNKHASSHLKRADGIQEALTFLASPSLFEQHVVVTLDALKEINALNPYTKAPLKAAHLILGLESGKQATQLYQSAMREVVLLDLSNESLGERRYRLRRWASRVLEKEKKKMAPSLIDSLIERVDLDLGVLRQEVEKLVCFVGDKAEIKKEDLDAICVTSSAQINGFKLAERLIEGSFRPPYRVSDLSELLPLIGQIRYLFEMGLKLTSQLEKGEKPQDKNLALVRRRSTDFFKKGLMNLFHLELRAKQSLASPQLLFDYFCYDTLSIAQPPLP